MNTCQAAATLFFCTSMLGCGAAPSNSIQDPGHQNPVDPPESSLTDTTSTAQKDADFIPSKDNEAKNENPVQPEEPAAPRSVATDPYADMPHPPDTDSGRQQLSAADVKEMVETYRPHMRELCWIPRVNQNPKGSETVRIALEVDVARNGEVNSVKGVGGQQYEGLNECVKEHVKRWHFPKAKQSSSLMFPIVFNRGESKLIQVE